MSAFDYDLPSNAIAQVPLLQRDAARLLVDRGSGIEHRNVTDLPALLHPGDVLVLNETRVLPARLHLSRPGGGTAEVLLLERNGEGWEALVRPGRKIPPGTVMQAGSGLAVEVGERLGDGRRRVVLHADDEDAALVDYGVMPLPPYIHTPLNDPMRYQTVYASVPGSAAAPTAGLHLTAELLARCREREIRIASVALSIGLDTFRPITAERPEDHVMHTESYRVPTETMRLCESARRVIAVGTTTVRALETAAKTGQYEGRTSVFIRGDFPFAVVDTLLTNFHQPRSSLLLLLDAFIGDRWRDLYQAALAEGYRFLSFGDAMLVDRGHRQ